MNKREPLPTQEKIYLEKFDDNENSLLVAVDDSLNYRYQVIDNVGNGAFGSCYKCLDHKKNRIVAVKIIKNQENLKKQSIVEVNLLRHLNSKDPLDKKNIVKLLDDFVFRSHHCLVFELLSMNLYSFLKNNNFAGFQIRLVQRFAMQLLISLHFLEQESIVHCDIKPENIMFKTEGKSAIKLIDFGTGCFKEEQIYTYIQSRFYRSPEIILGFKYSPQIDMWSFGCLLFELYKGVPLFPGQSEH